MDPRIGISENGGDRADESHRHVERIEIRMVTQNDRADLAGTNAVFAKAEREFFGAPPKRFPAPPHGIRSSNCVHNCDEMWIFSTQILPSPRNARFGNRDHSSCFLARARM